MDALLDTDWAAHWTGLVEAREAASSAFADPSYWDRRARSFAAATANRQDGFLELLEPWLDPHRTLLDVGAGAGRHAAPLADRLEWVTAVEPSQGMRELIPHRVNMTVIGTDWELAEPAPADLVICCHVLYGVRDAVAFIRKLEASARERVFIQLRMGQMHIPAEPLWEHLTGAPRPRMPQFGDLWNLLQAIGVRPYVGVLRYQSTQSWDDGDAFLAEHRETLAKVWDEAAARAWMEQNLGAGEGGRLVYDRGLAESGVVHWQPPR